ncbi:ABC transporter permease [Horticoccus luteus]|uniref:ABC transporter permease n=1 Tax=Horticoccus luteus TaxID=2862869 RepID=A0A8F9XIR3_9BACT|nr:ABC transporter permease [Horticoccus luteus]QYM80665.1 ABC transporter permease [Horticoccus luteus]
MLADFRAAVRQLAKCPGFTAVAVLTLALCIGANSAIFSVLNAILLKPYPWPESEQLVYANNTYPLMGLPDAGVSIPDYLDRRTAKSFVDGAIYSGTSVNLAAEGTAPERINALSASPSLFPLLRVPPLLGRTFTENETDPGAPRSAVLSYDLWQNRFGGDRAIIGRDIRLNGEPVTVVGVMPPGFYFPSPRTQLWIPFRITPAQRTDDERGTEFSNFIGRLKPGVSLAQAQAELDALQSALAARLPALAPFWKSSGFAPHVIGFLDFNVSGVRAMLWFVQAGVVAALLIGCANVASLLLARAMSRERELAIRAALGASRRRLVQLLLTESVVLFLAGGALGLVVALWGISALNHLGLDAMPRGYNVALDARVFVFTLVCALASGLAFGAFPAWQAASGRAVDALKEAGTRATASRRHLWLRSGLVVAEIALSLMLVATAALLVRSFARLQNVNPGFNPAHVLTAQLALPATKYPTPEKQAAFADAVLAQIRALPGVTAAGLTTTLPFSNTNSQSSYNIVGYTPPAGQPQPHGQVRQVTPGYFASLGIPLLRGRLIDERDTAARANVVVIDHFLADRYFAHRDPVGAHLKDDDGTKDWEIVGVVGTIKNANLDQPTAKETLYYSFAQSPARNVALTVKTARDPATLIAPLRQTVLALDPEQPLFDVKLMTERIDEALVRRRAPMLLIGIFATVALLLAALGVYGVLAFAVGQRTPEIGVRMALGAQRGDILRLILRQGTTLIAVGLALGLAGYLAVSRLLGQLLYDVAPTDPLTLLLAPALLAAVALLASFLPARRATKVDPLIALRSE